MVAGREEISDGTLKIGDKAVSYTHLDVYKRQVNKSAMNGTILAHTDGDVPNLMVKIPDQNEFYLGQVFYFFEFACGVSGYISGVNPFNQPGVESYKKNMFAPVSYTHLIESVWLLWFMASIYCWRSA